MDDLDLLFVTPTPRIMPEIMFSLKGSSVQAIILGFAIYLFVMILLTIIYWYISKIFKKYSTIFIILIPLLAICIQNISLYIPLLLSPIFPFHGGFPFVTFITSDTADRFVYRNAYFLNIFINLIFAGTLYGLLEIRRFRKLKS